MTHEDDRREFLLLALSWAKQHREWRSTERLVMGVCAFFLGIVIGVAECPGEDRAMFLLAGLAVAVVARAFCRRMQRGCLSRRENALREIGL